MAERAKLGELLVRARAIDGRQLAAALEEQKSAGRPLGMTLVHMGFVDEETLIRALAAQLSLPVVHLRGKRVGQEVLDLVPLDLVEKHRCLPLLLNDEKGAPVLYLAMEDPTKQDALEEIREHAGRAVKAVLVAPGELDEALHRFYHWASFGGEATPDSQAQGEPEGVEPELILLKDPPQVVDAGDSASGGEPATAGAVTPELILRALTQLLVEKGLLTREELIERLREVQAADASGEPEA